MSDVEREKWRFRAGGAKHDDSHVISASFNFTSSGSLMRGARQTL